MPQRLNTEDADFATAFEAFLGLKREVSADVADTVAKIITDVQSRGDAALIDYTRKFDRLELTPATIRVTRDEIERAVNSARCR